MRSPAAVAVVSGGGGGLASDFVSPSGSCLTRPFHAKDVGGGFKGYAHCRRPPWQPVNWWLEGLRGFAKLPGLEARDNEEATEN